MYEDIKSLFVHDVVATYNQLALGLKDGAYGNNSDTQRAVAAARSAFHFREHLPEPFRLSRRSAEERCLEYRLIADLANASKHSALTKDTPQGPALIASASAISEVLVVTSYVDEEGEYRHVVKTVQTRTNDGVTHDITNAICEVVNFWGDYLVECGHIREYRQRAIPPAAGPVTRLEANHGHISMAMVQGLDFRARMLLQRFNPETGQAERVDLTGQDMSFRIYKPAQEVADLVLAEDATGRTVSVPVTLTEQQALQFASLHTEEEREEFLQLLPGMRMLALEALAEAGLTVPPIRVNATAIESSSGLQITVPVTLTGDLAREFAKTRTDEERADVISRLPGLQERLDAAHRALLPESSSDAAP